MRLINADELLKYMETTEISQSIDEINKGNDNYSSTALYGYIKEMPTAYDVDKVVERLEENAKYSQSESDELAQAGSWGGAADLQGRATAYKYSVDIVKSGGIE